MRPVRSALALDPSPEPDSRASSAERCTTCAAFAPIARVHGRTAHDGSAIGKDGPLELVVHGDAHDAHDFHTGRVGSFDALFSAAAAARADGRSVLATTPLTRSSYRIVGALPLLARARGIAALRLHVPELLAGARVTLVPRLALALPFALHALAAAQRLELPAFVSGAPLCLLGPFASRRIDTPPRAYGAACASCPARTACPGVDQAYLDAFGNGELRPAKAAPLAPSAHPLAALFAR